MSGCVGTQPQLRVRLFVGSREKNLNHVEDDHHNHHAGAPVVESANQASAREFGDDVLHAVVGFPGRGRMPTAVR